MFDDFKPALIFLAADVGLILIAVLVFECCF